MTTPNLLGLLEREGGWWGDPARAGGERAENKTANENEWNDLALRSRNHFQREPVSQFVFCHFST